MMSLSFPDWMPLWGQLLMLAGGVVFGLAFLMMPFAVFGVKGRLAELSFQVQELQAELRSHVLRGDAAGRADVPPAHLPAQARAGVGFAPVVEEVRVLAPAAGPERGTAEPATAEVPARPTPRELPVFPELRAPHVSDAYDARPDAPPEPQAEAYGAAPVRRMPWHEPERVETGEEIMRRQRAPDANQPAYRPDFSREQMANARFSATRDTAGGAPLSATRQDEARGRVEPVLKWPFTASPDHRGE